MILDVKREYKFDKLYNFRDIGDLVTENGEKVKAGVLFRSDDISRLSKNDLILFQRLGLKLICDLRTKNERKSKMYRFPDSWGTIVKNIPIYHGSQDLSFREFFCLLHRNSNQIDFENMMKEFYHCMVNERKKEIKNVVTTIANSDHIPALIHCTGGKDRTGFISAIIQLYLGVPYEKVIDQYLLSNTLVDPRMKQAKRFIQFMSLYRISSERIKPLLVVHRTYLEEVLVDIFQQYGSIESYLINGCEIGEITLQKLRGFLID